MVESDNKTGLKDLIFNRRYKAWKQWFYALTLFAVICAFKNLPNLFQVYAIASTAGLGALIGGLSATDWMKTKNGGGGK